MTHVCFNWSARHNLALQQILPPKRKEVTFTSALLAQNSTDPLCREKDLHSRRLWKDICCRELCGANAWQVLSTWLSQVLLWVSWFCSLCFLSVNSNSWNQWSLWIILLFNVARSCWWEFLRSEGVLCWFSLPCYNYLPSPILSP